MGRQKSAFPPFRPVMVRGKERNQTCNVCLNISTSEPAVAFNAPFWGALTMPASSPESSSESRRECVDFQKDSNMHDKDIKDKEHIQVLDTQTLATS